LEPFFTPLSIAVSSKQIKYPQKIVLTGSCFTEHIGNQLSEMKLDVLQNPNGILFDPLSVAHSLISYIEPRYYTAEDLFYHQELWQSWKHHGQFSHTAQIETLDAINQSQKKAHLYLKQADWLIITLGSSFSYKLKETNMPVANCHRTPGDWFIKRLLPIEEILAAMDETIHRLLDFNPSLQIIFTISPVRHIRDGVVENNRSKARLIEAVHQLVNKFTSAVYFPAYEIVIDVLRDYRFYDKDLVHPNYSATGYVLEKFMECYLDPGSRELAEEVRKIAISYRHRPLHPDTSAHRRFLKDQYDKALGLAEKYPFLDFTKELEFFGKQ
jgi:GSCFA family